MSLKRIGIVGFCSGMFRISLGIGMLMGILFLTNPAFGGSQIVSFSIPINVGQALVYSGPGNEYYTTGSLEKGEMVEVYMRNADGWCAIRPPQGSFSWINARFVQLISEDQGIIRCEEANKEVPVRVGAESVMKSTAIQIGLKDGKKLQILGEITLPGGSRWFKIAPPSGEFRYVHEKMLYQEESLRQLPDRLTSARENVVSSADPNSPSSELNNINVPMPEPVSDSNSVPSPDKKNVTDDSNSSLLALPSQNGYQREENFYMEVSRLNRDLFTTVNENGSPQSLAMLNERCSLLFQAAQNDEQRTVVKNIYDTLQQYASYRNTGGNSGQNPGAAPVGSAGAWNQGSMMNSPNQFMPGAVNPQADQNKTGNATRKRSMAFAFSGENGPFRKNGTRPANVPLSGGNSRSRSIFAAPTGPTVVPPPDYTPIDSSIPEGIESSGSEEQFLYQFSGRGGATSTVPDPKGSLIPSSPIRNGASEIKTVGALLPFEEAKRQEVLSTSGKKLDIATWKPSSNIEDLSARNKVVPKKILPPEVTGTGQSVEQSVPKVPEHYPGKSPAAFTPLALQNGSATVLSQKNGFDMMGRLGYFPNRPEGYPAYALVDPSGKDSKILCYLEAESGENLDRFVGKTIGIKGKKGWFQRGTESRMLITATSIFSLKETN